MIGTGIPYEATVVAGVVWGVCGGVFINTGRMIFQETASPEHRARVLAIYSLGFMGSAAIGSPLAGFLAEVLGPLDACAFAALSMLAFVTAVTLFTPIARFK